MKKVRYLGISDDGGGRLHRFQPRPLMGPGEGSDQDRGHFSPVGRNVRDGEGYVGGMQLYMEEIGYQAAGRKIELIVEDDEANPGTGLTKTRKLVEKDGVNILTGATMASTGYALAPYIDSKEIPTTYPIIASEDLTQRQRPKWIVRTGWNGSQSNHALGDYTYKILKHKKAMMRPGLCVRVGVCRGLPEDLRRRGRQDAPENLDSSDGYGFQPLSVTDFEGRRCAVRHVRGPLTLQFLKQYQEFGLKGKIPVIGGGTTTDENVLPSMGDEAIGVITALHYSEALDNPANKKFVKAFREKAKKAASYYSEGGYTGAMDRGGDQGCQGRCGEQSRSSWRL